MQTAAGRATAARGPDRQPLARRWSDLLGVDQLLEALTGCRCSGTRRHLMRVRRARRPGDARRRHRFGWKMQCLRVAVA